MLVADLRIEAKKLKINITENGRYLTKPELLEKLRQAGFVEPGKPAAKPKAVKKTTVSVSEKSKSVAKPKAIKKVSKKTEKAEFKLMEPVPGAIWHGHKDMDTYKKAYPYGDFGAAALEKNEAYWKTLDPEKLTRKVLEAVLLSYSVFWRPGNPSKPLLVDKWNEKIKKQD